MDMLRRIDGSIKTRFQYGGPGYVGENVNPKAEVVSSSKKAHKEAVEVAMNAQMPWLKPDADAVFEYLENFHL